MAQGGDMNGGGKHQKLEKGTAVLVLFKGGNLQQPFIIGTFSQNGNHNEYKNKGELKKPGDTIKGAPFSQPSGHPNVITQTDANYEVIGSKNLQSAYSSPEYGDVSKDSPVAGIIKIDNKNGDSISYSQSSIQYVDGNDVRVTAGTSEQKTSKLLRNSIYHAKRAQLFGGSYSVPASAINNPGDKSKEQQLKESNSGIKNLVILSSQGKSSESIPIQYRAQSERKLADLYAEAAKNQASQVAAKLQEASNLNKQFGNEISAQSTDPNQAFSKYTPPSLKAQISTNNYSQRSDLNKDNKEDKHELLVVLHETVISADKALKLFQDPRAEVSYHIVIKRDGTIVELVDPSAKAFGAGNSSFKKETFVANSNNPGSVNNFSYHISLESIDQPPIASNSSREDLQAYADRIYTNNQYESLAYAISKTGVNKSRIVTHREIDNSGTREDPRGFDMDRLTKLLNKYPNKRVLNFGPGIL
jgi:N-acetyl-anhydromuramyl-L-alanine amidase AmpD